MSVSQCSTWPCPHLSPLESYVILSMNYLPPRRQQISSSQNEIPQWLKGGATDPFLKLNILLFGLDRQTPAFSSKNCMLHIREISQRGHITVLPCNYNLISCQNLLRMTVKLQKEEKQEQVKCLEKQMEVRCRWKKKKPEMGSLLQG